MVSIKDAGSISDPVPRARTELSHEVAEVRGGQSQFPGFQAHGDVTGRVREPGFLPH